MTDIAERLDELRGSGLHRRLRMVEGPQGAEVLLDGRPVLLLCSNNYLGLAGHPRVREAAAEAAIRWGAGAGASRLVSGGMGPHRALEERLAEFKGYESALLFGSGYLANTGVIAALAGEDEVVFSDELNHASIIDGCRLARAETFVYRHCDLEHLAWGLRAAGERASLIVTDGLFSMDGDRAPLEGLLALAERHRCRLMVDEAHATGTVGPGGRGTVADAGLSGEVDLVIGTLGKALGSYGAYACADAEVVEYLVNTARSLIFSTALPPPSVAAADEALALLEAGPEMVQRLGVNAAVLREAIEAEGLLGRAFGEPDRPGRGRRLGAGDAPLRGPPRTRSLRPGNPAADRARGHGAPALHRDVDPRPRVAAAWRHGSSARRPAASASAPSRPRSPPSPAMNGVFVTGTGTEVGKTVVAAAIARTLAASGATVAVFKPAVTGLEDPGEPDHELLRRAAGSDQSDEEIAPYRYGPPASPHLAARLAGEEIDPARLRSTVQAAAAGCR